MSDGYQGQIYQVGMETGAVQAINMPVGNNPVAVDYDPIKSTLYWTDNRANVIKGTNIPSQSSFIVAAFGNGNMCFVCII